MPRIMVAIECGNAAFGETPSERADEVGRLLERVATAVRYHAPDTDTEHPVHDLNGNRVGAWRFEAAR